MKIVIFVRHGESTKNVEKTFTSEINNWPLTEKGRQDIERVGKELANLVKVNKLYASPLLRTRETAEIISKYIHIKPGVSELLTERYAGRYENTKYRDSEHIMEILNDQIKKGYPDWESWDSMMNRMVKFVGMLKEGEITVAATHGGNIKSVLGHILGKTEQDMPEVDTMGLSSGSITIVDFDKKGKDGILVIGSKTVPKDLIIG